MHLKVFLKLKKKTLKTLSSGQIYIYKKKQKTPKNPKKRLGWFFFKTPVFSNPASRER
jgi:hypothetical protein